MKQIASILLFGIASLDCFTQTFDTAFVDGALYAKLFDTSTAVLNLSSPPLDSLVPVFGIDTMFWPFKGFNTGLDQTYRLQFSEISKTDSLIAVLEALPMIEYAEKVPLCKGSFVPDDLSPSQLHLTKIQAEQAWNISKGSTQVVVAIVDNGVRLTHEDLAANIWVNPGEIAGNGIDDDLNGRKDDINGFDIADNDNNPNPPPGISASSGFVHGTHCAGIASAVTDNGTGIASIGFKVKIMAVKVSRNSGNDRELTHSYEGIYYAMRAGADVISMSFGGTGTGQTDRAVIDAAFNSGIVLVAAAGNESTSTPSFPAAFPNVISVGATDNSDRIASFSNFGSTVDVMAPGVTILSTLGNANNAYGFLSGTSMATPLVAGMAALIISAKPGLTPAQVRNALTSGCDDINSQNPGFSGQIGAGRINAFRSLSLVTAIDEPGAGGGEQIHIYPNPFHDYLHIARDQNSGGINGVIFDRTGKRVFESGKIFMKEINLPVQELPAGIYFLRVKAGEVSYAEKIVKR